MDGIPRTQTLYAISRNGLYWCGRGLWHEDIRLAAVFPEKAALRVAKIDIGLACELIEVLPVVRYPRQSDRAEGEGCTRVERGAEAMPKGGA